jgi:hypothetical protein
MTNSPSTDRSADLGMLVGRERCMGGWRGLRERHPAVSLGVLRQLAPQAGAPPTGDLAGYCARWHPDGMPEEMLADLGPVFHPDYRPVLRAMLFRVDLRDAKVTTGITIIAGEPR